MKTIEKHSNYEYYILCQGAYKLDMDRLSKAIEKATKKWKDSYIRFMNVANSPFEEPMCVLYDTPKGNIRLTKLVSFSELETFLEYN